MSAAIACVGTARPAAAGEPEGTFAAVSQQEATLLHQAHALAERDPAAAIALIRDAVTAETSPVVLDTLGVFYQQAEQLPQAARAFRDALARAPGFTRARENLAKILLQQQLHAPAMVELRTLLEADPELQWARITLVRLLLQDDKFGEAAEHVTVLLDSHVSIEARKMIDGKGELWRLLGYCRLSAGHAVAAEAAFLNALAYDPDRGELRMHIIQARLRQGDLAATRTLVARELNHDPMQLELWRLLASVEYQTDNTLGTLVRLECARRLGLAEAKDLADIGDLMLEQGITSVGLERYLEASALDKPPADRLLRAAEAFAGMGRPIEAGRVLQAIDSQALPLTEEQKSTNNALRANIAELEGNVSKALELYDRLLAVDPLNGDLLMRAGRALQQLGELDKALLYYERAARASSQHKASALVRQAQIAVELEHYKRAVQLLRESLDGKHQAYVERYLEQIQRMVR